ncbi:YgfZ/GcvT domain-containing protein [Frateuria soli]|uniref:CAF17-like 4Fe-4S cluster assembly/insertion protein YgfZ n=1 Tax=Frateuria soli TaxID=1542730 RepID=UPI001E2F2D97|nr:folate-binding protein [Frateuria soli]UGB39372.1 folate-binding protein [Frateuria soli]
MPSTYPAELVALEGPDAIAFAQAQFSSNLATLADGQWQFSAWLDAQGRVRALFHLMRLDAHRLRLLLRGGEAQALAAGLQRYVFRASVRVSALPARELATVEATPLHAVVERDDTLILGCGSHGLKVATNGDDAWRLPQLRAGWPWLPAGAGDDLLPAWLDLGRLGATALDKGCYPGQELVARMHYRGGSKRRLRRVRLSLALEPGSGLEVEGGTAIRLLDVAGVDGVVEALAVVHDDTQASLDSGIEAKSCSGTVFVQAIAH